MSEEEGTGRSEGSTEERSQGFRRFPTTYFRAKPIKVGDELDVTISEVSRRGDGLTRVQGYVVFVPNTKQGDSVKVRITQIRPNYAIAQVI